MLTEWIGFPGYRPLLLSDLLRAFQGIVVAQLHRPTALVCVLTAIALFGWRYWRFTIWPLLYPNEVQELPYWIPCHGISFYRDSHKTLTEGREYFADSRRPFLLTLAGEQFYVLTSADDISEVYKTTETLSYDSFVRDIMAACGASPGAIEKMWQFDSQTSKDLPGNPPNTRQKCLAQLTRDFHKQQLHPGEKQTELRNKFLFHIEESLHWETMRDRYILRFDESSCSREILLKKWCGDVLLEAATRAFFGKILLQIKPDLFHDYFEFDDSSWQLLYRYPRFLAKGMYHAKDSAVDALTRYFVLPSEERGPEEAWFVRTLEGEQRKLGIGDRDIATLFLMVYWVINANTYKLCFWTLAYLLYDPVLLGSIREETTPAFASGDTNIDYLLESSPRLNALFDEVLRITNSSSSVRSVTRDTMINGSKFRAGKRILMPYRQLHFDKSVFDIDAQEFDARRFLKHPGLSKSQSYRPFGGGSTYCPGRFIARLEVVAFVAIVLQRFNVELVMGENKSLPPFPRLEEMRPCLGIMPPVQDGDLIVKVSRRTQ